MKKKHIINRALAFVLSLALVLANVGAFPLAANAAQDNIDSSLQTPFGLVVDNNVEGTIGVSWGNDGVYQSYTVSISCAENGYSKVYSGQTFSYHTYPDDYADGVYVVEIQGEKDGVFSPVASAEVTVGNTSTPADPADDGEEDLIVPFGLEVKYDAAQGIGTVWGSAGYETYKVTIACAANGYSREYPGQTMGYHWYPDSYAAGEYTISLQGEKNGKLSEAGTSTVTVGGETAPADPDPVEPEPVDPVDTTVSMTWAGWTGEGGAADFTEQTADGVKVKVNAEGNQNYAVQYCGEKFILEAGKAYKFSADFEASADAKVEINIQETLGWASLLDSSKVISIPAGKSTHVEFTTKEASGNFLNNAKIALMFGKAENVGKTITVSNLKLEVAEASDNTEDEPVENEYINFEAKEAEENGLKTWSENNSATYTYDGTKATITSGWWGEFNWWTVQFGVQNLALEAGDYAVEFDVTSTFNKSIYVKLTENTSDTPIKETTVELTANEKKHVSMPVSVTADGTYRVYYNLAGGSDVQGSLTIENLKIASTTEADDEADDEVDVPAGQNILKASDWFGWTGEGGAATFDNGTGDAVDVTVNNEGTKNYAIQYINENLGLKEGHSYRFVADFYSDTDAGVQINLQETMGWASLFNNSPEVVSIKAGETKHVVIETLPAGPAFVTNGKIALMFGLGCDNVGKTIKVSNLALYDLSGETTEEYDGPYLNLEKASTELYTNSDWSWSEATKTEKGPKAVINATAFGGGWDNTEWGLQYNIQNIKENADGYNLEFDITSTVDKNVTVKLDDKGLIFKVLELKANETYHFAESTTDSALSNGILYFALGRDSKEGANPAAGVVTIENISGIDVVNPETAKGNEYNFDDPSGDCADPGLDKEGYTLIWNDEFDGNYGSDNVDANTGLDLDKWAYQLGDGTTDCGNTGWGNQELQAYTNRSKNIAVNEDLTGDGNADGLLRITGSYEQNGYVYGNESKKNYTSGRIRTTSHTQELFNTTYGYIEARISMPGTQGAWPAFWMLPQSTSIYGGWPVSGELDIMETTAAMINAGKACGTLHWGTPSHVYKGSGYVALDSELTYFHTYGVDWQPGKITWYFDGEPVYTSTNWESAFSGASGSLSFDAPFDQPFYILLNLAIDSGNFGGSANKANFQDDINMYVDYVRAYQLTEGYNDSVVREAQGTTDNWEDFAGVNQIADITADNLVASTGGHDDNSAIGTAKWYLSTQSDANASAEVYTDENGKVWDKVSISQAGSNDYSVQLIGHYDAKNGYVYKVSFDAFAEGDIVGKNVNCDSKEYAGWSTYGVQAFSLQSEPTSYSYTFQQTENFDNCRIEFNIGAAGLGNVYISNVKVEIVDPALLGTSEAGRQPLADGNMIYNSSFDQGNHKLGFWTPGEGTTVVVPRYTTEKLADSDVKVIDVASKTNYEGLADGVKYYERRAQISAKEGVAPSIMQKDIPMTADTYTINFDLYSKEDTAVKVAIYSQNGDELNAELVSKAASYSAADGVKSYTFVLTTDEDLEKGAVVFKFAKGTSVQLDNVTMTGENQASAFDENPVNDDTTWNGDNGAGTTLELITEADGAKKLAGITSGGTWYSPQIGSSNFAVVSGVEYKLSFKYKTDLSKFKYIIQQAGGSWTVVRDVTEVVADANADTDGYSYYELEFVSPVTLTDCHVNFGFGDSGASNGYFVFKDVNMSMVKGTVEGGSDNSEEGIDDDQFIDDETAPVEEEPVVEPIDEPTVSDGDATVSDGDDEPTVSDGDATVSDGDDEKPEDETPSNGGSGSGSNNSGSSNGGGIIHRVVETVKQVITTVVERVSNVINTIANRIFRRPVRATANATQITDEETALAEGALEEEIDEADDEEVVDEAIVESTENVSEESAAVEEIAETEAPTDDRAISHTTRNIIVVAGILVAAALVGGLSFVLRGKKVSK
ncbi:MAG: glycoside hydrolase family 16 protein [Acetatifactor sp.]|nr:glycoside hydrolase family 16 protein [Acetatifactor sp.]